MKYVPSVLAALLCVSGTARAQPTCSRADLQSAVDSYVAAQAKGDSSSLPLAPSAKYLENMEGAAIDRGILKNALKIDFHRSLLDVEACETFTEVIVTDERHPYFLVHTLTVCLTPNCGFPVRRQPGK